MEQAKPATSGLRKYGVGLLIAGLVAASSGWLVFVGPLIVAFAPDFLLAGTVLLAAHEIHSVVRGRAQRLVIIAIITLTLALNTRIPSIVHDLYAVNWSQEKLGEKRLVELSQPIRIVHDGKPITGRHFPYATSRQVCEGDVCFTTRGFRTPWPDSKYDYWAENPVEHVALDLGFSMARPGETAPTLEIKSKASGYLSSFDLRLTDESGRLVSTGEYTYRNGFPLEPVDDNRSGDSTHKSAAPGLSFLLHGNVINDFVGRIVGRITPHPVRHFLAENYQMQDEGKEERTAPVKVVRMEVLGEEVYEPPLIFKGGEMKGGIRETAADPWPEKGYDADRNKYCDVLMKPESQKVTPGKGMWWVFAQDPTGRRKVRRTQTELCDERTIWSFAPGNEQTMTITKYAATGELLYRLSFQRPSAIYGYSGGVRQRTFQAKDGYIYFEWMDSNRPGYDLHIKRNMRVRIPEPMTN